MSISGLKRPAPTANVRAYPHSRDLEDLEACEQDAEHAHARIEELVQAGEDSERGSSRFATSAALTYFERSDGPRSSCAVL